MELVQTAVLSLAIIGLAASTGFAASSVAKGKKLFSDAKLGTNGMSCSSCHPDGKGLEKAGLHGRQEWTNPGSTWLNLEDTNNVCIMMALKGKNILPYGFLSLDLSLIISLLFVGAMLAFIGTLLSFLREILVAVKAMRTRRP